MLKIIENYYTYSPVDFSSVLKIDGAHNPAGFMSSNAGNRKYSWNESWARLLICSWQVAVDAWFPQIRFS
jgi:hypothetical protein